MKPINVQEAYNILYDIRDNEGINIDRQVSNIELCKRVPLEVLIFINKYRPIEQLSTYNHIYNNRRKNPLYHNLVNENLPLEEKALALSSYVTQVLIKSKELVKNGRLQDSSDYLKFTQIDKVLSALSDYAVNDNSVELNKVFFMIRDIFKNLYFDVE